MSREILTVRVEPGTRKALDGIAEAMDRDRSYVINEALDAYVEVHRWQIGHIQQGLREAKDGKFAPPAEVDKAMARLRRK